jgi:hypothetical protein
MFPILNVSTTLDQCKWEYYVYVLQGLLYCIVTLKAFANKCPGFKCIQDSSFSKLWKVILSEPCVVHKKVQNLACFYFVKLLFVLPLKIDLHIQTWKNNTTIQGWGKYLTGDWNGWYCLCSCQTTVKMAVDSIKKYFYQFQKHYCPLYFKYHPLYPLFNFSWLDIEQWLELTINNLFYKM